MVLESSEYESTDSFLPEVDTIKVPRKPKYECTEAGCNAKFKRLDALDLHVFKHTGVKKHACLYLDCDKTYRTFTHLKRHVHIKHERVASDEKTVPCLISSCKQFFINNRNMQRHIREVHENPKIYKCSHCEETFTQKQKMRRHEIKQHTGIYPYNCEKCGKGLFLQYQYEQHVKVCKVYPCADCEEIFDKWTLYTQHCREKHYTTKAYKCEYCDKCYKKPSALKEHVGALHALPNGNEPVYKCTEPGCGRAYAYERNLKAHIRSDHGEQCFKCPIENCEVEFTNKQELIKHRRQAHKCTKSTTKKFKSKKARKKRKDAGVSKSSILAKLANVEIDKNLDILVRERDADALKEASDKFAERIFSEEMDTE